MDYPLDHADFPPDSPSPPPPLHHPLHPPPEEGSTHLGHLRRNTSLTLPVSLASLRFTSPPFYFNFLLFRWSIRVNVDRSSCRHVNAHIECVGPSTPPPEIDLGWQSPCISFRVETLSHPEDDTPTLSLSLPAHTYSCLSPSIARLPTHGLCRFASLRSLRRQAVSSSKQGSLSEEGTVFLCLSATVERPPKPASPLLVRMLDDPARSLADVRLLGADSDGAAAASGNNNSNGNDNAVYAHRCVLASVSEYFRKLLCGGWREGVVVNQPPPPAPSLSTASSAISTQTVRLNDVSVRGLRIVVHHLYGGELSPEDLLSDLHLYIEVWTFASVRLLTSLEKDLSALAPLVARLEETPDAASEPPADTARFARVFETAVMLGSTQAVRVLALNFECVLRFSIDVYESVLGMSVDCFETLLGELPPTEHYLELCKAWLDEGDGTRMREFGERVCAAFGVDEMPVEALRAVGNYEVLRDCISAGAWVRIAKALALACGEEPKMDSRDGEEQRKGHVVAQRQSSSSISGDGLTWSGEYEH